jgi:hypothetical protein
LVLPNLEGLSEIVLVREYLSVRVMGTMLVLFSVDEDDLFPPENDEVEEDEATRTGKTHVASQMTDWQAQYRATRNQSSSSCDPSSRLRPQVRHMS